jgi:hypothetical protein
MCDMKKDKDRPEGRSTNNNKEERSSDKDQRMSNDQTNRRQRSSRDNDLEKALSRGFFPDGPGGNYKGV